MRGKHIQVIGSTPEEGSDQFEDASYLDQHSVDLHKPEDFGWTPGLARFTGFDARFFADLLPALRLDLYSEEPAERVLFDRYVDRALLRRQRERGTAMATEAVRAHLVDLRMQHRNLLRRRQDVLRGQGAAVANHARATGELRREVVNQAIKEHRRPFEYSEAQTRFRELDRGAGHKEHQVHKRQDSRFGAMLQHSYGGRKAIRTFLATSNQKHVRVAPQTRPDPNVGARRRVTAPPARRHNHARRATYFNGLLADLEQGGPRPPTRTTRLWDTFAGGQRPDCAPPQHQRAAFELHRARKRRGASGVSADPRPLSPERRQETPEASRAAANPQGATPSPSPSGERRPFPVRVARPLQHPAPPVGAGLARGELAMAGRVGVGRVELERRVE